MAVGYCTMTASLSAPFPVANEGGIPMRYGLAALAACCVAGPLAGVPAPRPKLTLLYPSNRTGNLQIFVMNPDGTGAKNLTNTKAEDCYPAVSPDGSKIAFTSNRD